jgi:small-conductance mechanosensitive channel
VERVALDVAREVIARCPEAVKDQEAEVRFKEFGDSNVEFTVLLKSVDRISQFALKHEFIKALHRRFKAEGITVEYPVRKLLFSQGDGQQSGESAFEKKPGAKVVKRDSARKTSPSRRTV